MRRALVLIAAALMLPGGAAAHVTVAPPFIEDGVETDISLTVPNERLPHSTVAVRATMPAGIAIDSTAAPEGWNSTIDGSIVTWSSGERREGRSELDLSLRIQADVRAGTYAIAVNQTYDDGAVVRSVSDLSVVPGTGDAASEAHPWATVTAAIVGVVAILGGLLLVRHLRRRSLQDP